MKHYGYLVGAGCSYALKAHCPSTEKPNPNYVTGSYDEVKSWVQDRIKTQDEKWVIVHS